jgi:OmpA-OmpF porin, OOP family
MTCTRSILPSIVFASLLVTGTASAESDIPGSRDHPLITRIPGYYISQYEVLEFARFDPTVIGGKAVNWEGRRSDFGYSLPEGGRRVSMLQIVLNYEAAVTQAGGKMLGGDERRVAAEIRKGGALTGIHVEAR